MRDDEDNIRQYLPVLRRIIILVAVLTAIPVVMWTATAFVRSHVSAPRPPALQPMAIAPSSAPADTTVVAASDQPPTQSANAAQATQPKVSAYADVKGGGAVPAPADATPTGATPTFKTASVGAPSNAAQDDATPTVPGSADAAAPPADGAAGQWHADRGPAAGLSVASGARGRRIAAGRSDLRAGAAAAQASHEFRGSGKCADAGTAA
jgi:hypothetical protein